MLQYKYTLCLEHIVDGLIAFIQSILLPDEVCIYVTIETI